MSAVRGTCLIAVLVASLLSGCMGGSELPGDLEDAANQSLAAELTANDTIAELTASWPTGASGCTPAAPPETEGLDHAVVAIDQEMRGFPFVAQFTSATPADQYKVSFFQGELYLSSFRTGGSGDGNLIGRVPAGADQALVSSCGGSDIMVTITVSGGLPSLDGTPVVQREATHWRTGVPGCAGTYFSGSDGYDHGRFFLLDAAAGQPFTAHFSVEAPAIEYGVDFFNGSFLDSFSTADLDLSGRVPEGAAELVAWSCGGTDVSFDFVVLGGE